MRRTVVGTLAALLAMGVFAGAMIPFRSHLSDPMTALVLVVPIVIGVVAGGLVAGIVSVFSAFFVYVYFFVPPYLTTSIGSAQNWLALAVYMVITLPVAYVVDRMHGARSAERRRNVEIRQLLELSELLVEDRPLDMLLATVVAALFATFDARQVAILLPTDSVLGVVASAGDPVTGGQFGELVATWESGVAEARIITRSTDPLVLPLSAAGGPVGLLVLAATAQTPHDHEALLLFANQIALSVERVQLRDHAIQTRLAARVDRLAKMLVAAVSHDIRTPLASIKASSSILADDSLEIDDGHARELAQLIDVQADRLAELVQDLLDMGRIQAGVLQPRLMTIDLRELVDSVVAELAPTLDGHVVDVDLAADLPTVSIDPLLIERVLVNLLVNAARHAPNGTRITIAAERSGTDGVEVSVADRGPGVTPERRADMFGLNARRDEDAGAGLGLIMARTFVEAHHQRIWLDAAPAGGARFCFTLSRSPWLLEEGGRSVVANSRH